MPLPEVVRADRLRLCKPTLSPAAVAVGVRESLRLRRFKMSQAAEMVGQCPGGIYVLITRLLPL